jgi:hypothetical protein
MNTRDDFPKPVVQALAKRSAYICANPKCRSLTLFPSKEDLSRTLFLGVAAHITAAAEGGPRYDSSLTTEQRSSMENGIFLCAFCSSLIDRNNGIDFPAAILKSWKNEHEDWIRNNLNKSADSLSDYIQAAEEKRRRQDALHALVHELYVNMNILHDPKYNPPDGQTGTFVVYPRLLMETADHNIASGSLRSATDKKLLRLLYSWKEIGHDFNHRLDVMEQCVLKDPSIRNISSWQTKLTRTGRTLPSVRANLQNLLERLVSEYSAESGIDRNTILFE